VLDLRLYRATVLPFLLAVLVAAFSLSAPPSPLSSTFPPDAFNGARAFGDLQTLAASYPRRAPGSSGDNALARYVTTQLELDGFQPAQIRIIHSRDATARGERNVTTVIAAGAGTRRGSIVLLAHRDATSSPAEAALSGTATLLELAADLGPHAGARPVIFVSTSGGSGGNAGAILAAAALRRPIDAAIVIGDVAGTEPARPFVVGWTGDGGVAPLVLTRTVERGLSAQLGASPGNTGALEQLARFALPLSSGEQGVLADAGIPTVLVQQSGELGPGPAEPVSQARLSAFGRGILVAVEALESGPRIAAASTRTLTLAGDTVGGWVIRLLGGLLLASAAACTLDIVARARRRRIALAPWLRWLFGWAAPFFAAGLFAKLLVTGGLLAAVPATPLPSSALPLHGEPAALVSVLVVLVVGLIVRAAVSRPLRVDGSEAAAGAPAALLALTCGLATIVWIVNPYSAALIVIALQLWLVVMTRDAARRSPLGGALCLLVSLAPLGILLALEAHALALGPVSFIWMWLLVFAGGEVGLGALVVCSLLAGVIVAAALILLHPGARGDQPKPVITVRGPASYAGPGSLGGTESALRR
jgi:hypothetical protein